MVTCTPTKKARLFILRKAGNTYHDIAHTLGLTTPTVARNFHQLEKQGRSPNFYLHKVIPGRPKLISPHAERRAVRLIYSGTCADATDVQRELFPQLHPTTVRRMFIRKGLYGRVRRRKPWLPKRHILGRKIWAKAHFQRTLQFWRKVWYSDESKFNLFGSDGRQYCRRRAGEELLERNVVKTMKHGGGSLMVWGCISWNGTGRLHRVEGHMNAAQYCSILSQSFLSSLKDHKCPPRNIIFQQDNDPKHTSYLAKAWFTSHHIRVLPWAPSSPDQNIIEHAWDELDVHICARNPRPRNLGELWVALQEEWAKLDVLYIRKLYTSIPARVRALKEAKGKYTRY